MSDFERVHTMTDYYDGPRGGMADFNGYPHLYESIFQNETGYQDQFRLSPVAPDVFELAMEDWKIWLRWETAFHQEKATRQTHPALPEDRERHEELQRQLEGRMKIDPTNHVIRWGYFQTREDPSWSGYGARPLEVRWTKQQDGES